MFELNEQLYVLICPTCQEFWGVMVHVCLLRVHSIPLEAVLWFLDLVMVCHSFTLHLVHLQLMFNSHLSAVHCKTSAGCINVRKIQNVMLKTCKSMMIWCCRGSLLRTLSISGSTYIRYLIDIGFYIRFLIDFGFDIGCSVLYAVDKGLCVRNILQSLLLILLRIIITISLPNTMMIIIFLVGLRYTYLSVSVNHLPQWELCFWSWSTAYW